MVKKCVLGCSHDVNVTVHLFPSDPILRDKWLKEINKPNLITNSGLGVCSKHFYKENYVEISANTDLPVKSKTLRHGAIPSITIDQGEKSEIVMNRLPEVIYENELELNESGKRQGYDELHENFHEAAIFKESIKRKTNFEIKIADIVMLNTVDIAAEIEIASDEHQEEVEKETVAEETDNSVEENYMKLCKKCTNLPPYFIGRLKDKPKSIAYLTGLENYAKFKMVLYTLGPKVHVISLKSPILDTENQFLTVLWKLRRNVPNFELAMHFDISESTVRKIFITWIRFMALEWSKIETWPSRELVDYYMPYSFQKYFPKARVIVDGTEIPITRSQRPKIQQASFSTYKNRNTVKVLFSAAPGGIISHCTKAYGGSTSDRQVVERSSLPKICEKGDEIIADKGFKVQDLFASKGVVVTTPTFLTGKNQLSGMTILRDRKLSRHRVHIERVIGLAKTYNILKTGLNQYYVAYGSEIIKICVMLSNFRECIVK